MLKRYYINCRGIARVCFPLGVMLLVTWISISSGRASGGGGNDSLNSYISTYTQVVYENYRDSLEEVKLMEAAVERLLIEPTAESLEGAKMAWLSSREAYGQSEAFRFYGGPIDYFNEEEGIEGPEGRMNAWPLNEAYIDYVVGNPDAGIVNNMSIPLDRDSIVARNQLDDDSNVSSGYHAIEFLLWGQDSSIDGPGDRPFTDFVPGTSSNDRRRDYLRLLLVQLIGDHKFLVEQWSPGRDNYAREFGSFSAEKALKKILVGMLTLAEFEIASERLAVALDSGDQEDEHSCFSDNTHNDFIYNARGIANVYFGRYSGYQGVGLDEIVQELDAGLNSRIRTNISQTLSTLGEIPVPFDRVLSSPVGSAMRLQSEQAFKLLMLQGQLIKEVGFLFGLDIQSNDGSG